MSRRPHKWKEEPPSPARRITMVAGGLAIKGSIQDMRGIRVKFEETTSDVLVDSVSIDTELANKEGVLWYPDLTSWNTVKDDWSYFSNGVYGEAPTKWPKLFFTTAPEFGDIPAMRFESVSTSTLNQMGGYGYHDIAALWKYFDSNILPLASLRGSSLWSTPRNNLHIRYSIMFENDMWIGLDELGLKMPGFAQHVKYNETIGLSHTWMHHSKPGAGEASDYIPGPPHNSSVDDIYLQTYAAGGDLSWNRTLSQNWLYPGPISGAPVARITYQKPSRTYLHPGVWHTIEQRWKLNGMQPNGTGNFDGELDIWCDDELQLSMRNTRFRTQYRTDVYDPVGVQSFHLIVYHGGMNHWPVAPIHCRVTGVCLSDRRIGATKRVGVMQQAAQSLSVGSWVELPVPESMLPALIQTVSSTGAKFDGHSVIGFCNEATWNTVEKKINIIAKRSSTYPMRLHQYRAEEHDWIIQNKDMRPAIHEWGHGYDYNVRNSFTGRLYFKRHPSFDGLSHRIVYYADPPNYSWSLDNKLPLWPDAGGGDVEAQPAFFWSGSMSGIGSQGAMCLCVSNGSGGAAFVIYNEQAGSWRTNVTITPPGGRTLTTFEKWGSYSAVHNCAVVILSDDLGNPRAYRLNDDATVTLLTAPSVGAGGNSAGSHAGVFTCDPVSGDFLLLNTSGSFWKLNPTGSGTWTQLTGSRTPPTTLYPYGDQGVIVCPIPDYGVVSFTTISYPSNVPHMYIYKHA